MILNWGICGIKLRRLWGISGIWRGGVEHKVSLYADDPLVFISNPNPSIPSYYQFGQFSWYKLNWHKSEFFPVVEALTLEYINFPFRIVEDHFTYLGITVAKKTKCLFKKHFLSLLNNTELSKASESVRTLSEVLWKPPASEAVFQHPVTGLQRHETPRIYIYESGLG